MYALLEYTFPPLFFFQSLYCSGLYLNIDCAEMFHYMISCCRFINIVDAEKCGLPRVLDTIEVSCKTRHNIKLLCNLIYDTVFSLRPPGSVFSFVKCWLHKLITLN